VSTPTVWGPVERWFPNRATWSRARFATWSLAMFLLLAGLPYVLVNQFSGWRATSVFNVETGLDTMLPFTSWMMVPYVSFYAYFPLFYWAGARTDRRRMTQLANQRLIQATWLVLALFVLFPVEVDLRHQVTQASGITATGMGWLHAIDTPYNAWPSLHIVQSLLVLGCLRTWMGEEGRPTPVLEVGLWVAWGLLCASTMLVKQHYVFDVVTGVVFAALVWRRWFKPLFNQTTD
jgi:membrane-associated phospholipid phosphatase